MDLTLSPEVMTIWQITLVAGVVVLVAVIALLSLLLHFVRNIEASVQHLGVTAQGVRDNTAHIKVALAVVSSLDEITDEAGRHARLLGVGA